MGMSVSGNKPTTDTGLYVACINLRWPNTGDQENAMKLVLAHPKIRWKIDIESKKLADLNPEIDRDELKHDIKTLLYLAIKKEFSLALDPQKMEGWLCARIAWRALDHITKECDLIYTTNPETGKPEYRRIEKVPIDNILGMTANNSHTVPASANKHHNRNEEEYNVSFGDMMPAGVERHKTFEGFLRKAHIKTQHKHVLMYIIAMNYNFRELADIYSVSSPTARKLYKAAVASLKRYIESLGPEEQNSVQNLLRGVYERS